MGKRRIGIITFHKAINYGAVLQAYALEKYMESRQCYVEIIQYNSNLYDHYELRFPQNIIKRLVCKIYKRKQIKEFRSFQKFWKSYMKLSKEEYDRNNIEKRIEGKYDALIVGSDQVWNPNIIGDDFGYLLDFNAGNAKRYSYAASIGLDSIDSEMKENFARILSQYDGVSVRESQAIRILGACGLKSNICVDPTLLVSEQEWTNVEIKIKVPKKYVLLFSFGEDADLWEAARIYARMHECSICYIGNTLLSSSTAIQLSGMGPSEWLYSIHHAECVFTNSYHGMMFSLIYKRDFWVSDPKDGTNSRIEEVLNNIGCNNRIIKYPNQVSCFESVSYDSVCEKLEDRIEKSKAFLERIINLESVSLAEEYGAVVQTRKNVTVSKECTGCSACDTVCPKSAIVMKCDAKGSGYPYIDESVCVNCGICKNVCPIHKAEDLKESNSIQRFYALKSKSIEDLKQSSSGGAFGIFAGQIIADGGVVFGVKYERAGMVVYGKASNEEELKLLVGTKYVESEKNTVFLEVLKELNSGKKVLFSGTPCMVAGLKSILGNEYRKQIIFLDIICHGVPVPIVYKRYLEFIETKYNSKIKNINFRDKVYDKSSKCFTHIQKMKIEFANEKIYHGYKEKDPYYRLFFGNAILRECCYKCKYSSINRVGDITIGDFWGDRSISPTFFKTNSESSVIINTETGLNLFLRVSGRSDYIELKREDIMQRNLYKPTDKSKHYIGFWRDMQTHSFRYVLARYADYYGLLKLLGKMKGENKK